MEKSTIAANHPEINPKRFNIFCSGKSRIPSWNSRFLCFENELADAELACSGLSRLFQQASPFESASQIRLKASRSVKRLVWVDDERTQRINVYCENGFLDRARRVLPACLIMNNFVDPCPTSHHQSFFPSPSLFFYSFLYSLYYSNLSVVFFLLQLPGKHHLPFAFRRLDSTLIEMSRDQATTNQKPTFVIFSSLLNASPRSFCWT